MKRSSRPASTTGQSGSPTPPRPEGVTLRSLHLPFSKALHIDHLDDEADRAAVDTYRRSMHAAAEAGIRVFVVHPSYEPIGGDRPQRMERSRSNLALLVREAESLGARLCVENMARTCLLNSSAEMIDCLKAVPGLYMCFDSNHLLGEANPDFLRLLYEAGLAGRIGNVHISDYDFIDERHELPGNGKTTGRPSSPDWKSWITTAPSSTSRTPIRPDGGHHARHGRREPRPAAGRRRLTNGADSAIMKRCGDAAACCTQTARRIFVRPTLAPAYPTQTDRAAAPPGRIAPKNERRRKLTYDKTRIA